MSDPTYFNYQPYETQVGEIGATNVLPTIQGTTEVLPPIGGDFGTGFIQGENTVLEDTAGLGVATATTQYFGATTNDANIPYTTAQEYPATTTDNNVFYGGEQVYQATADPTTIYGGTQVTTDNNAFFTGVATTDNTTFFGTPTNANDGTAYFGENQVVTDANGFQGAAQLLPATNVDANTFFAGTATQIPGTTRTTTTTTTTKTTTFGTTGVSPSPVQQTVGAPKIPTNNQVTAVGITNDVRTNVIPGAVAQNQVIQKQEPVVAQPQVQLRRSNKEVQHKFPGGKVYDEDFRRGRPVYNDKYSGSKYEMPRLIPRPVYKPGVNNQVNLVNANKVNQLGVNNINNVGLGVNPGLSKLQKEMSYDIRGKGIQPLLNNAGLGPINTNLQPAGQNPKVLGNIKDFL